MKLRPLQPGDLDEVRQLCQDWFPVDYPQSWYEDITSSSRFYSRAAVYESAIVGLIVAEIKPFSKLNREVRFAIFRSNIMYPPCSLTCTYTCYQSRHSKIKICREIKVSANDGKMAVLGVMVAREVHIRSLKNSLVWMFSLSLWKHLDYIRCRLDGVPSQNKI